MPRQYAPELGRRVIDLIEQGRSIREVAELVDRRQPALVPLVGTSTTTGVHSRLCHGPRSWCSQSAGYTGQPASQRIHIANGNQKTSQITTLPRRLTNSQESENQTVQLRTPETIKLNPIRQRSFIY